MNIVANSSSLHVVACASFQNSFKFKFFSAVKLDLKLKVGATKYRTIGDTVIQSKSSHSMMLAYSINKPGDTKGEVVQVPKPVPEGPGFALIRVLVRAYTILHAWWCVAFVYELH